MNLDGFALPIKKLKGTDPVESLDFHGKGLGPASAVVIASLIGDNASVTSIDLSGNNEGEEGMQALGEGLLASTSCKLQSFKCSKFDLRADATSLDLSRKGLGPGAAVLLSAAMTKFMASITSVDVGFNSIGKEAALELINIFKEKKMVSVGLANCSLGPKEAPVVADMIRVIPSITKVLPD